MGKVNSIIAVTSIFFLAQSAIAQNATTNSNVVFGTESDNFFLKRAEYFAALDSGLIPIVDSFSLKQNKRFDFVWKDRAAGYTSQDPGNTYEYSSVLRNYIQDPICNGTSVNQSKWEFVGPKELTTQAYGIITAIWADKNNDNFILAGSGSGGIWKTEDFGQHWRCVTDEERLPALGIRSIVRHPVTNRFFASTGIGNMQRSYGIGILFSDDNGESWSVLPSFPGNQYSFCGELGLNQNGDLFALIGNQIFKSSDNGATWHDLSPTAQNTINYKNAIGHHWAEIDFNPNDPNSIIISGAAEWGGAQLFRSMNGGMSWENISTELFPSSLIPSMIGNVGQFNIPPPSTQLFVGWQAVNNPTGWHQCVNPTNPIDFRACIFPTQTLDGFQRIPGLIQLMETYEVEINFETFIPAGTELILQMKNSVNGNQFIFYNSGIEIFDRNLIVNHPFSVNGYYDVLQVFARSDNSYNQQEPLWIDKITLFNPSKTKFSTSFGSQKVFISSIPVVSGNNMGVISDQNLNTNSFEYISLDNNSGSKPSFFHLETVFFEDVEVIIAGGVGISKLVKDQTTNLYTIDRIIRGSDASTNFHDDTRCLFVLNNGPNGEKRFLAGNDGGVSFSNNGGNTYQNLNGVGLFINQFYGFDHLSGNQSFFIGGTQDNGSFVKNNSVNWSPYVQGDGGRANINPHSTNEFFDLQIGNGMMLVKSLDFGATFANINPSQVNLNYFYLGCPYVFHPTTPNVQFAGMQIGLAKSIDGGQSFQMVNNAVINKRVTSFSIHPIASQLMHVTSGDPTGDPIEANNRLFQSDDGGATWTPIAHQNIREAYKTGTITQITYDPINPNRWWVSFGGVYYDPANPQSVRYRVLYTADGGSTFTDISSGLPPFPVNDLVYQKNSDDIIYAGTDVGVFYWDKNSNSWHCYNNDLPVCWVTQLRIDNCSQELYISTFGRGIWKSPLMAPKPLEITTNIVWGTPVVLQSDVLIKSGNSLTVTGSLEMPQYRRIMVEPGARLIVNGGTITGACNKMWTGIEVWGNSTLNQTGLNQGRALFTNATIENATNAVSTARRDVYGNIDFASTGGVIIATNSTFRNNKRDVEFLSYNAHPQGNISRFHNNLFVTTGALVNEELFPQAHVTLWDVHGVQFSSNTFSNTTTLSQFDVTKRGKGIATIDATYRVYSTCSTPTLPGVPCNSTTIPNRFIGLHTAIDAKSSNPLNSVEIDDNEFTNNQFGVLLSGINFAKITHNTFSIPGIQSLDYPYGVYLKQCSAYEVEENKFETITPGQVNVGIAVINSGFFPNEIYNNSFKGLYVALLPMGLNRNIFPGPWFPAQGTGLQLRCNQYVFNEWDQAVTLNGMIAAQQGADINSQSLAGNRFSHNCIGADNDFLGLGMPSVDYWSHSNIPPVCFSNSSINLNLSQEVFSISTPEVACPSQMSSLISPIIHKQSIYLNKSISVIESLKIDAGNKAGLLNIIANQPPGQIKNALLNASPYLSDEVLLAAINKNLPAGIIRDIILANSPLSADVLAVLNTKSYPPGIKNQMLSAQTGVSGRTKLEAEIAFYLSEADKALSDYVRYYLFADTTGFGMDSIAKILKEEGSETSKCLEIAALIKARNYAEAQTELAVHLTNPDDHFCKLLAIILDMEQNLGKCFSASLMAIQDLEALSTKDPKFFVCAKAQSLLETIFDLDFPEPIELPYYQQNHAPEYFEEENESNYPAIKVYPNPSSGLFNFEYSGTSEQSLALQVFDLSGRCLLAVPLNDNNGHAIINLSTLTEGMYFYKLMEGDRRIGSGKVMVTR